MSYVILTLPHGLKLRLLRQARERRMGLSPYIVEILEQTTWEEPSVWKLKRAAQTRDRKRAAEGLTFQVAEGARPITLEDVRKDEDEA